MSRLLLVASLASGCCFAPLAPAPVPPPSAEPVIDPALAPPDLPSLHAPDLGIPLPHFAARDPFALDADQSPQVPGVRALFDAAAPVDGALASTVLVCSATLLGGDYDDSLFAGGADVALAMRIGTGAVRSTPQSSERVYSFTALHLAVGESVWMRVIDRDILFDDTIAEGSAEYARTPLGLTMGQANVECRALDPALVSRRATEALTGLQRATGHLHRTTPDLSASDLGYPLEQANAVTQAANDVAAWLDPSDARVSAALEPAHAWLRQWDADRQDAITTAQSTLPSPGSIIEDGHERLSIVRVACGADAMALRAEIGDAAGPNVPTSGCIAVMHLGGLAHRMIDGLEARAGTWALDDHGDMLAATTTAIRVNDAWRSIETRLAATGPCDVALALDDSDAALLRVGPPYAHGQVMRLR